MMGTLGQGREGLTRLAACVSRGFIKLHAFCVAHHSTQPGFCSWRRIRHADAGCRAPPLALIIAIITAVVVTLFTTTW